MTASAKIKIDNTDLFLVGSKFSMDMPVITVRTKIILKLFGRPYPTKKIVYIVKEIIPDDTLIINPTD